MAEPLSVTAVESRLPELLERATLKGERFVVEENGRPAGAIVSADDLARIERGIQAPPTGLLAVAGVLEDVEEFGTIMEEVVRSRRDSLDFQPISVHRGQSHWMLSS